MSMLEITGSLEPKKTAPVRTFLDDWKSFSNEKEVYHIYISNQFFGTYRYDG